jgi:hypothetical protein
VFGMHAVTYPCMLVCADAGEYAPRHRTHETWSNEKWEWGSEGKHVARRRLSRSLLRSVLFQYLRQPLIYP